MSQNRHMSSLRKFRKSKQQRRKSSESRVDYQTLEDRKLLAADVFADVLTGSFGRTPQVSTPNQHAAIGPNHIVEVTNGRFRVFDKVTHAELLDKSMTSFWLDDNDSAATTPGANSLDRFITTAPSQSKVLYDPDVRRWYVVSQGTGDANITIPFVQRHIMLAVSRTSNPLQDWTAVSDVTIGKGGLGTSTNRFAPTPTDLDGAARTAGITASRVEMAIDDHNLYLTIGNEVLAIDKFNDLAVPDPFMAWFDPELGVRPVYSHVKEFLRDPNTGDLILDGNGEPIFIGASAQQTPTDGVTQFANDIFGTTTGSIGLTADDLLDPDDPEESTRLQITEITDVTNVDELQFSDPIDLTVDAYQAPPDRVRQLFDPDIEVTTGANLIGDTVRVGDSLYAVHSVLASNGNTAAVRWYEITGLEDGNYAVAQTGTIESEDVNYIYPSIAVTPDRNIAITYTAAGLNKFATLAVSLGYENNGEIIMEDPLDLKDGEAGYLDGVGNLWGLYNATVLDPEDPTRVYSFGQWSDDSENGSTQMVGYSMIGHSAELMGDENDNVIVVRRSAADATQIEVEIDGLVTNTYEERILHSIQLDGGGGDDTFIVDTSNGEMEFAGGVIFVGDSDDQVELVTDLHTTFDIAIDGSGTAQVGNDFASICNPVEDDVRTFVLNFEEGSGWFDATPFDLPGYETEAYATYGDAYRGELQKYFDEIIAPIFAGSFTMTLDITDNETDTAASASAQGFGFEDVNGENLRVASPWSILTGRGDRNGIDVADGRIDYNLDINAFYGGDGQLFLDNLAGGLTRSQFFRVLGMDSDITDHTNFFDPRGTRRTAQYIDTQYIDLNGNPLLTGYDGTDSTFLVDAYTTNANWAGDNSGLFFRGVGDDGMEMLLPVNSNSELIDFDVLASALAGTSRDGDFNDIVEQDRAFLRGMGYELNPIVPIELQDGLLVTFSGIDELQSGDGDDEFCIRSSNVDFELRGGIGNDTFFVTGLGVGALDLLGQQGDDTYSVVFSPSGVVTIVDSVGSEFDELIGVGTTSDDSFIFGDTGISANSGQMVYTGLEKVSVDGREGNDLFEINAVNDGTIGIIGGLGMDTFRVNNGVAGTMTMSVADPLVEPLDQLFIDINSDIIDSYTADTVENFEFDGRFVVDTVNGVPMNGDGLNLLGDGDDQLTLESVLDTAWMIDGDGSGNFVVDIAPAINFVSVNEIVGSVAVDTVNVTNTNTDLLFQSRDADDIFTIDNVGLGLLTLDSGDGMDTIDVTNSGGGVNLSTGMQDDTVSITDLGTGAISIDTEAGMDTVNLLTVGSGGVALTMGTEDDTLNIDNAAGIGPIDASGGMGNDSFNVINSGVGDVVLRGEMGDDSYLIQSADPTVNLTIDDTVNAEADVLVAFGTVADDVLNVSGTGASLNGAGEWTISGIESYTIDALAGNDVVDVDLGGTVADEVTIVGGDGNDDMTVRNTGDATLELQGGDGDDNYTVFFGLNTTVTITDSVGSENDTFTGLGTSMADTLVVNGANTAINGGSVSMTGIENLIVDGFGGDDDITIDAFVGNTTVRGGSGIDTFTVSGNLIGGTVEGGTGDDIFNVTATGPVDYFGDAGSDTFNVDMSDGGGDFFGGDDDDVFNIMSVEGQNDFFGDAGSDSFIITNHLPLGASSGLINIDGGTERNSILVNGYQTRANFVTVTDTRIAGMSGIPIQYTAAGAFSLGQEIGGIKLMGSDNHSDIFEVNSLNAEDSLLMLGMGGNERFTVRSGTLGRISSDGQEGSDLYQYAIGSANSRFLSALDTGISGSDRIVATLTDGDDNLVLSGESFPVDTDSFRFNENFESLIVNARDGNDTIDINRVRVGFLRVIGSTGNDVVQINNFTGINNINLDTGLGDDTISVNSGNVIGVLTARGGEGNDTFNISQASYGDAYIDGQNGNDTYNILVADRSDRFINARDTGDGVDNINITGTVLDDRVTMRSGIVTFANQNVLFNENTEEATINAGGAEDIIQIYGFSSQLTNVNADAGEDLVFVNSTFGPLPVKNLNIDLGVGNDTALVRSTGAGTRTEILGNAGNDVANLGSSLAANNGNLATVQGDVHFDGGIGQDRLNLNDVGRGASVNYDVGLGMLTTGFGSSSTTMGDFSFDSTEVLRLETTNFRNHVNVTASTETAFSFFGNGGFNTITLEGDMSDGRTFAGENGGTGTWSFDNDQLDVYFEDFFIMN
ncbi:MAG: hypothetical protein AAFN77_04845 [Planctomycetota bacterium]